jgi:hypothetical protein
MWIKCRNDNDFSFIGRDKRRIFAKADFSLKKPS